MNVVSKILMGLVLISVLTVPFVAPTRAGAANSTDPVVTGVRQAAREAPKEIEFGCSLIFPSNLYACVAEGAYGIMNIMGGLMNMASLALNYSLQKTVVGMGVIVNGLGAVDTVWRTMRDLVNILLVFLTIFIGIATILGISGYGYKQLLWKVILAAVFVNFSITLAKFVIDVGNIFAITIYEQALIVGGSSVDPAACAEPTRTAQATEGCLNNGIGIAFMSKLRLLTIYSVEGLPQKVRGDDEAGNTRIIWISLFGSVFFLIAAFIFAAAAFLIVLRFVVLIILIMVSPVGLVAWITGVSNIGRQWWHKLIDQSFFLPIMILFWWMGLNIFDDLQTALGVNTGSLARSASMPASASSASLPGSFEEIMGMLVYFILASAFLIGSLVIARNMGAQGATMAVNVGRSWSRKAGMMVGAGAGAATLGASAWALRRGIGGGASRVAESKTIKSAVASGGFIKRNAARLVRSASQGIAGSSFDARAVAGKNAQQWIGKGQKGGYTQWRKDQEEKVKEEKEWIEKPTATDTEKYRRDRGIRRVEEDHHAILAGGNKGAQALSQLEAEHTKALDAYTAGGPKNKEKEAELQRIEGELKAARAYMDTKEELKVLRTRGILTAEDKVRVTQLEKALETARSVLEARRGRLGAEIDRKYLDDAKTRGKNMADGYLNNMSKSDFGMALGGYSREFIGGLRGSSGKAKALENIEKALKDLGGGELKVASNESTEANTPPVEPAGDATKA